MQHVLILTRLTPQATHLGRVDELIGVTSDGRSLLIRSEPAQRVNVAQLQHQITPLILLCDQLQNTPFADLEIPSRALVSIIPLPADEVGALLREGKEALLLEEIRAQLG
ncbi:hypothetical protein [Marinobacterium sediminicola]|uniref:Uncharacterized protein n=1 Tax=Marinobacterium sediminicola TaxID=518898 RepID=A0ABY1S0A4_9GAMM|nr:hypothetical protein [Marinobacterium sediminicola]ULG69643.1 hypothetical protein LN244_02155 [Marinobacterium sediminicola]SMR74629.1 hypothetical protein SAMN04487964_10793 [Marinobacterium sediminicola]